MTSKHHLKEVDSETHNAADEKAKKEELVEARMKMIRKKNEELLRRQKEIEEDRKNADRYSEMAVKKHPESFPSGVNKEGASPGRGRGRGLMLQEMRKETLKAKQWEAKRRDNVQKEEEQIKKRSENPNSASRFLADDDRVDMSKTPGRNERSWGGASFNQVVNRVQREKEGFQPGRNKGNIEMTLSGKERLEYSQWREERTKIDQDRKARQKKSGNWSRAWDQRKIWDPRKRMWVYENDDGDNSFKNTRWQDNNNGDDWGRDYGDRGSDRQRSRHSTGFGQHDDRELPASDDWGETRESRVAEHADTGGLTPTREEWGETSGSGVDKHAVGRMVPTKEEWGETSKRQGTGHADVGKVKQKSEEWGETKEGDVAQNADVRKRMQTTEEWGGRSGGGVAQPEVPHQHDSTVSDPSFSEDPKNELSTTDNKEEITQRRQLDSADNDQINENKEFPSQTTVQQKLSSNKQDLYEPVMDMQESTNADKGHDKLLETHSVSTVQEKEFQDGKEKSDKKVFKVHVDTGKGNSLSKNEVGNNQETTVPSVHSTERKQTTEARHHSGAEKANLPKLITKVDKKVTFDTEENEPAKETDAEDSTSVTIGDIPPTPDFLKLDHSLDWGDIEVETEDSEVIEPKW